MKTISTAALAFICALTIAPYVGAHEGHDHKIMGTVAAVHDNKIDVKAADGKVTTVNLSEKTKKRIFTDNATKLYNL